MKPPKVRPEKHQGLEEGWQRFKQNPAIFFLERTLNAFQLLISCDSTADGIIHVQGGQKPGLWSTGKTKRLWASVRRFRPWAESKVIGQERPIIRQDWKQSLVARFATFPGAKWPIFTRIVATGQKLMVPWDEVDIAVPLVA